MLGANDAAEHQSAATFGTNLDTICDNLIADGYTVILSYPIYIPAGANGGATDAAAVDLAIAYRAQIDSLINGTTILRGDTIAWQHFLLNNDEMQSDDTHPTAAGAVSLGGMWARAIDRSVLQVASGSGGVTRARSASGLGAMG
jgi:lysophospholipase L1-like esterase